MKHEIEPFKSFEILHQRGEIGQATGIHEVVIKVKAFKTTDGKVWPSFEIAEIKQAMIAGSIVRCGRCHGGIISDGDGRVIACGSCKGSGLLKKKEIIEWEPFEGKS